MGRGQLPPRPGTALCTGGKTRLLRVAATRCAGSRRGSGRSLRGQCPPSPQLRLLELQDGWSNPSGLGGLQLEAACRSELPSSAGPPEPQPPAPFPPRDLVSYFFGLWFSERNQHINDFFPLRSHGIILFGAFLPSCWPSGLGTDGETGVPVGQRAWPVSWACAAPVGPGTLRHPPWSSSLGTGCPREPSSPASRPPSPASPGSL